ncbi:hypothetical protein BDW74DRAFT_15258 [Aspergillus multicolor]|uniref:uncharacterized protein n=1 Tax=Aspergillus multicolor TaxID=41759 RepID=UPI003CCE4D11
MLSKYARPYTDGARLYKIGRSNLECWGVSYFLLPFPCLFVCMLKESLEICKSTGLITFGIFPPTSQAASRVFGMSHQAQCRQTTGGQTLAWSSSAGLSCLYAGRYRSLCRQVSLTAILAILSAQICCR